MPIFILAAFNPTRRRVAETSNFLTYKQSPICIDEGGHHLVFLARR